MLAHDLEATQGKGRGLVARDIRVLGSIRCPARRFPANQTDISGCDP